MTKRFVILDSIGEVDIEASDFVGLLSEIETHGLKVGASIIDTEKNRLLNLITGDWIPGIYHSDDNYFEITQESN